jgi:hypothetical protein
LSRSHCALSTGAVIFYERFGGFDGIKDRYFIVLTSSPPEIECFTTTTQRHAETMPKLATEFCEIKAGECCLPKACFVDFRTVHKFDDIMIGSRLRSGSVKHLGDLPVPLAKRIRDAFSGCRTQSPDVKERVLFEMDLALQERS